MHACMRELESAPRKWRGMVGGVVNGGRGDSKVSEVLLSHASISSRP